MSLANKKTKATINLLTSLNGPVWKQVEHLAETAPDDENGFNIVLQELDRVYQYDSRVEMHLEVFGDSATGADCSTTPCSYCTDTWIPDLPDISIDPEEKVLTAINDSDDRRCFCISLPASSIRFKGRRRLLAPGHACRDGESFPVIAFVLVLPPRSVLDVCKLLGFGGLEIWGYGGHGGKLTHFAHPSTYYALDFDCPVGTPVLAMAEGTISEIRDAETASGVDVRNFFSWNQITIAQVDGTFAEYVHIKEAAAQSLKPGDRVCQGQAIAQSGDVGFCPTPHLHVEVHLREGRDADSVPFGFRGRQGTFQCEEGTWYTADGPEPAQAEME
ncbi:Glycyl-glycine endopeptidase ALE-1 [Symbiodinium microadriaticum]|uniref:Glycyl-glycine endopeptidase ALE-1 n=1 Tax=Symbiodinium microadriaticum TaxID=2951 RepID=A0A1Q9CSP9_SYMMI|nr:Glycyl-glycine endopeptidase ALE-1 [Symbiodinium microadriaticum]